MGVMLHKFSNKQRLVKEDQGSESFTKAEVSGEVRQFTMVGGLLMISLSSFVNR